MNEDVNKFVDELVKQLELPGRNTSISDDLIAELKSKATVEDATAAATIKDIDPTIINDALEAVGIMDTSVESDDITALFGLGDDDIIGGLPSDYIPREPTATDFYKEGDQYRIFANLPTEDLYSLQARLIQGGLLARGAFTPGDFDTATATAISLVLGRQNRLGVKTGEKNIAWNESLLLYQNEPLPSGSEVSVYLPPDYAEVSTRIRNLFTEELNRQPKGYELKLLAEKFYNDASLQSQQQSELSEMALGPTVSELEAGNIGSKDIQGVVSDTGLQQVSPTGRLYENFNNLIQKEKDRLGANADIQTTGRNMLGTILGTRR
jgi:hypothetical protein|tara:strand:+ start:1818 stop:2786 length:969 start_codon:yes stop_codon:yes gene_type:complete